MLSIRSSIILLLALILLSSCQRKHHDSIKYSHRILNDIISLDEERCQEEPHPGIDSAVGVLKCGKVEFNYDYGLYSDEGPKPLVEVFEPTFRAYHYSKFFMYLKMDEQAFKSLIPKARILDVKPKESFVGELMFECQPCNAVAQIEFINKVFNFPYSENKKAIQTASEYSFGRLTEGGVSYKWYKNKETQIVGMYAKPTKKTSDDKSLSIISKSGVKSKKAYTILKKIRLKKPNE